MGDDELEAMIDSLRREGVDEATVRSRAIAAASQPSRTPDRQRSETTSAAPTPSGGVSRESRLGDTILGTGRAVASGLTLGGADELEAFARSVLPGGSSYGERMEQIGGERRTFAREHPRLNLAGEIAGSVAPIGLVGRAAGLGARGVKAAGALAPGRQLLRGAITGAGTGAVAGGLSANDDRSGGAITGGLVGGILAPVAQTAIPAIGRGANRLRESSFVQNMTRGMPNVANTRGAVGFATLPDEAERLGRQFFGGQYGRAEQRAVQLAVTRAERDGVDFTTALQDVAGVTAGGRPVVMADMGGESTRRLLGAAESVPSPATSEARSFLGTRAANRPARMADDVSQATGTQPVNLATRADEIMGAESDLIGDMYERSYPDRVKLSPAAKDALDRPAARQAERAARGRAGDAPNPSEREMSPVYERVEAQLPGGETLALGDMVADEVSVGDIDRIKKRLDVMIAKARDGKDSERVRQLMSIKDEIVGAADASSQGYRDARGLFAETARRADAVETGAEMGRLRQTPDEVALAMERMSPLELDEARGAAAQTIRQSMFDGGSRRALNPETALGRDQRITNIFGRESADELERRTGLERSMRDTERAGMGSPTAGRQLDQSEIMEEPLSPAMRILTAGRSGGLGGMAAQGAMEFTRTPLSRAIQGMNANVAGSTGRLLLGGRSGPQELEQVLKLLRAGRDREANALAERLRLAAGAGNLSGLQAGR